MRRSDSEIKVNHDRFDDVLSVDPSTESNSSKWILYVLSSFQPSGGCEACVATFRSSRSVTLVRWWSTLCIKFSIIRPVSEVTSDQIDTPSPQSEPEQTHLVETEPEQAHPIETTVNEKITPTKTLKKISPIPKLRKFASATNRQPRKQHAVELTSVDHRSKCKKKVGSLNF